MKYWLYFVFIAIMDVTTFWMYMVTNYLPMNEMMQNIMTRHASDDDDDDDVVGDDKCLDLATVRSSIKEELYHCLADIFCHCPAENQNMLNRIMQEMEILPQKVLETMFTELDPNRMFGMSLIQIATQRCYARVVEWMLTFISPECVQLFALTKRGSSIISLCFAKRGKRMHRLLKQLIARCPRDLLPDLLFHHAQLIHLSIIQNDVKKLDLILPFVRNDDDIHTLFLNHSTPFQLLLQRGVIYENEHLLRKIVCKTTRESSLYSPRTGLHCLEYIKRVTEVTEPLIFIFFQKYLKYNNIFLRKVKKSLDMKNRRVLPIEVIHLIASFGYLAPTSMHDDFYFS